MPTDEEIYQFLEAEDQPKFDLSTDEGIYAFLDAPDDSNLPGPTASAEPSDADTIAALRTRREAEIGVDPYSGLPTGGPEQLIAGATPEEQAALESRARAVSGPIAAVGSAPLTGGLSLVPAALASGGAAGGARLATGLATGEEPAQAARAAAIEAASGAAGEGIGRGLATVAGKAVGRLSQGIAPPTIEGARVAQDIASEGALLSLPLQSESRTAKILESLAESSILGAGQISKVRTTAIEAAETKLGRFLDSIGSISKEDAGALVQETIDGNIEAFREASGVLYSKVDDLVGDSAVSLTGIKQTAKRLLGEVEQGIPSSETLKILNAVAERPNAVSFRSAARLRSDLLKVARSGQEIIGGQARGVAKALSAQIDAALETTAKYVGPEASAAFRQANEFYRQGASRWNDRLIKGLARARPEAVVSAIAKRKSPGSIRAIKKAINNTDVFEKVQVAFLRDLVENSFEASGDIARGTFVSGKKISTKLTNFGESALNELLGTSRANAFREAIKTLERTQQRTGSGLSGLNIRGGLESFSIATGNFALAVTPGVLAKALTNPRFVKLLTTGFTLKPGTADTARLLTRMGAILSSIESAQAGLESPSSQRQ